MSVPLTGSGGLFTRLGPLLGQLNDINSLRGGTATTNVLSAGQFPTRYAAQVTAFAAGTSQSSTLDGAAQAYESAQSAMSGYPSYLQQLASNLLVVQCNADTPLSSQTTFAALSLLISQMIANTTTVNSSLPTAGTQTAAVGVTNVGNSVIVPSVVTGNGLNTQYVFPETITFTCSNDGNNSATVNQEPYAVVGQSIVQDPLSWLWPGGSGTNLTINNTDATLNNSGGNLLNNSSFQTFSVTNVPDNWTIAVGTVTTNVAQDTSHAYYLASDVAFIGDGSTLTNLTQTFNTTPVAGGAGGTNGTLSEQTAYAFSLWIRASATPAAGVLKIALVSGTTGAGTVINDNAGNANSVTYSLTSLSTTYVNVTGVFRTPTNLPSTVRLSISLSTALSSGKTLYIGQIGLNKMTQLYAGGPLFSLFAGNTPPVIGDSYTIAIGNTFGAFQKGFERLFGMKALGLQLPNTSSSPTVSDSLVA
jgi:hypothetical protein